MGGHNSIMAGKFLENLQKLQKEAIDNLINSLVACIKDHCCFAARKGWTSLTLDMNDMRATLKEMTIALARLREEEKGLIISDLAKDGKLGLFEISWKPEEEPCPTKEIDKKFGASDELTNPDDCEHVEFKEEIDFLAKKSNLPKRRLDDAESDESSHKARKVEEPSQKARVIIDGIDHTDKFSGKNEEEELDFLAKLLPHLPRNRPE